MRAIVRSMLLGAAMAVCVPAMAGETPGIAAAVTAPGRTSEHLALDASRRPAEVLAFLGLKPGDTVVDVMAGSGYYTEIMARAVGGAGKVIAVEPTQFYDDAEAKLWDALKAREPNVELQVAPFGQMTLAPGSVDFALLHLVYHDLYWESAKYKVPRTDPAAVLKALHAAMRPGGIVGVVEHVAEPGDARATVDKLHRIDPATILADFKAAGFVLDGESDLLRMPADDHSKLVFDPAVRGKTDRVVYRFRKPA